MWFSMIDRTSAPFGIVMSFLPPATAYHGCPRPASPSVAMFAFTSATLLSCAARMSAVDVGDGGLSPLNSYESASVQLEMNPDPPAMCIARSPSDIDLACGFHASLSDGTRSSTRRVVFASCSNS